MHRILGIAALSCAAFVAAPVANATTSTPDVVIPYKDQRLFLISVGGRHALLLCTPGLIAERRRAACAALERVGGNPARLSVRTDTSCTMEYDPVTVRAWGTWDGKKYLYSRTFPNGCRLGAETGPVFRL